MKKNISIAIATSLLVCVALTGLSLAGSHYKITMCDPSGDPVPKNFVVLNCPGGNSNTAVVLVVQVRNLTATHHYVVKSAKVVLGDFWTNRAGNGSFTRNFKVGDADLALGALGTGTGVNVRDFVTNAPVLYAPVPW